MRKPPLTLFGWPGALGGSETKLTALGKLLSRDFQITWVPNDDAALRERSARAWIAAHGMKAARWDELPRRLSGWGVALCNIPFLTTGRVLEARGRGLRIAWGGEMMWAIPGELGALVAGALDCVLFTGDVQREVLGGAYTRALGMTNDETQAPGLRHSSFVIRHSPHPAHGGTSGTLRGPAGSVRWVTVGNYVDADAFPFRRRSGEGFTIGRLSRADWVKFPRDFPQTYEGLGLSDAEGPVKFRVMAWSRDLARRWPGHRWDKRWELLPALAEKPSTFLRSLDAMVYDVGPRFSESWGRAVVEGMLTGAVPLIPANPRHHLHLLVPHDIAGFHNKTRRDWRRHARLLQSDLPLRRRMSRAASEYAREELCNAEKHREVWRSVLGE